MAAPAVMVSSTFYDLRQVREDLRKFLADELGYVPLLSELPSFPVDPDQTTVENCRRTVTEQADIFVLLIGGRYGSIPRGDLRSVTNIEYLAARAKGIPIYVFVFSDVTAQLPVWERNKGGDFSSVVDSPKLFEFVHELKHESGLWVFPFTTAADVTRALRLQFAHLFMDGLKLRARVTEAPLASLLGKLSPPAARILLEKAPAWEYRLFFQTWKDAVVQRGDLLNALDERLRHGKAENVPLEDAIRWTETRFHELEALAESANRLANDAAMRAFGPPGEPGSPDLIVWVATQLGDLLETAIGWAQSVNRACVAAPFDEVTPEMARFADQVIDRLRRFPEEALAQLEDDLAEVRAGKNVERKLTMVLEFNNLDAYLEAMRRAQERLESGEFAG